MREMTIECTASIPKLDSFVSELRDVDGVNRVDVKIITKSQSSFLARNKQRQFEVVDAVVSVALAVASSAAYDGIRHIIKQIMKKNSVEEKPSKGQPSDDPKEPDSSKE